MEASQGLGVLIESMGRSEKRAIKNQLARLMSHVIKWKCQPGMRSASWAISIRNARTEIADSQEEFPSLNQELHSKNLGDDALIGRFKMPKTKWECDVF